jgi:PKD repeat protein
VTHAFATAGPSSATVTATGGGGSDDATVTFDVVSVNFNYSQASLGAPVVFTDNSSGGTFDSWLWDFGDGATSTAQNPSHTYAAVGPYTVTLTVSTTSTTGTASAGRMITVT